MDLLDELPHSFDECCGLWRLAISESQERIIRCSECKMEYPATPDARLSAIDENYAGIYLRRLAFEGAELLKEAGE